MPVSLTQIANKTATVTFCVGGDPDASLTVTYNPGLLTEKVFAQLQRLQDSKDTNEALDGFRSLNNILCKLISSWDAYEDEEQTVTIPITPDRLADLPIEFRMEVLSALMNDMRPEGRAPQTQS
jgi:hypothetical protein